jgi:anti-sigma factor RsiW
MTPCERRIDLGGHVLGGLDPDEAAAVEAHLARCEDCRAERDALAAVTGLLGHLDEDPPRAPTELRARVLTGVPPRRRRSVALAVACTLLGGAVGAAGTGLLQAPPPAEVTVTWDADGVHPVSGAAWLRPVAGGVRVDLELDGLAGAGEGYYHAWLQRGERRASAGTFVGPPDGDLRAQLFCGGALEDYDRLTVTWHPTGDTEVVAVDAPLAVPPPG